MVGAFDNILWEALYFVHEVHPRMLFLHSVQLRSLKAKLVFSLLKELRLKLFQLSFKLYFALSVLLCHLSHFMQDIGSQCLFPFKSLFGIFHSLVFPVFIHYQKLGVGRRYSFPIGIEIEQIFLDMVHLLHFGGRQGVHLILVFLVDWLEPGRT